MLELLLGMAISAVLMGALSSAMIVAAKAMPDSASPLRSTTDAALAIDQMADELLVAIAAPTRTPTAVEFSVADRNNDAVAETIRYEWSGTTGTPLRRKLNNGAWVDILDDVRDFGLEYDTYEDTSAPNTPTERSETLLAQFTDVRNPQDWTVKSSEWIGQYFLPTMPAEATSWKLTRLRLNLRTKGGTGGLTRVQVQPASASRTPTGAIIAESAVREEELTSSYLWRDVYFNGASELTPSQGVCIILQWIKDSDASEVLFDSAVTATADRALLSTANSGTSWTTTGTQSLAFQAYGTYMAPSASLPPPPMYLTGVRIKLRAGESSASQVETRVPVLNEPRL